MISANFFGECNNCPISPCTTNSKLLFLEKRRKATEMRVYSQLSRMKKVMIFTPKKHIAIENREERTDFDNIPKSKEIPT